MKLTAEEALKQMEELSTKDPADGHAQADELLCQIITTLAGRRPDRATWMAVVEKFNGMSKWYE